MMRIVQYIQCMIYSIMSFCFFICIILEDPVAIKAIDMKGVRDPAAKEMLQCEIEALNVLQHKNIMKCHTVIRQPTHCYIISQLCNGGDLAALLKRKGRLDQTQATKILKGIIRGYIQIASKGFLHRDLKLANVLLKNGQAKIADFGFAKKCKAESIKQKYNVGSPLYMSPQALKHNIYSMKNDIWSIGIMAFEMLHGDTPWKCNTERQLIDKMTKFPVRFNESLRLSNSVKDFIKKCLEVNEMKRMSLSGLKEWVNDNQANSTRHNNQNVTVHQGNIINRPTTFEKHESRPLSELTNRIANTRNSKSLNKLKTPCLQVAGKQELSKSIINYNNNILIKEMIVFRLFFKSFQKLKNIPELAFPSQLKNILGNQTIRRVTLLKKLIASEQLTTNQYYSLKNIQLYLNPIHNPDIKKYKNVVNQYFNKYISEVKMEVIESKANLSEVINSFFKNLDQQLINKQTLLMHWLINLKNINMRLSKGELQAILQPKQQIRCQHIKQRIEQLCI